MKSGEVLGRFLHLPRVDALLTFAHDPTFGYSSPLACSSKWSARHVSNRVNGRQPSVMVESIDHYSTQRYHTNEPNHGVVRKCYDHYLGGENMSAEKQWQVNG